jgi:putative MATE family efflux protein
MSVPVEQTPSNTTRTILLLAWPAILENLMNTAVYVLDSVFVGRLGTQAFAAVGQTSMIMMTVTFSLSGVGIAAGAIVARNIGRKDHASASEAAGQGMLLGTMIGVVVTVLGMMFAETVLMWLGTPSDVIEAGTRYLQIVFAGSIFRMVSFVGGGVLRAAGDTRTPMWASAGMNLFNVVGNLVLIFGLGPFPRMETDGAALATCLSFVVGAVVIVLRLFRSGGLIHVSFDQIRRYIPSVQKSIIRISLPNMAEQLLFQGGYWIFLWIVTSLGTVSLAAHFMAVRVESFSYMPVFGLAVAVSTLVGQNLGAGRVDLAEIAVRRSMQIGMAFTVVIGAAFIAMPEPFVAMFSPEAAVFPLACLCVQIAALDLPGDTILMMCTAAMRGAGDTITPMVISVIGAVFLRVGVIYLFAITWEMGLPGVWYGTVVDWTVRGAAGYILYKRGRWKRIQL